MDFRAIIKKNNQRTKLVIATYVFIMLIVGLLGDTAVFAHPQLSLGQNMLRFAKFEQLPIVTLVVMGCTLIGLFIISKAGHKMMLSGISAREITHENAKGPIENQLLNIIEELSLSASLGYIPKLYIMQNPAPNAFAAGWNKNNAILGITTGLLETLNRQEIQAVMAHEVGHIIHNDSKLTLYVGILANVILTVTNIFARLAYVSGRSSNNKAAQNARMLLLILNLVLPIITKVLYLYLSRTREYMADAAAVKLTGENEAMISALKKIAGNHQQNNYAEEEQSTGESYRSAAYIFNKGDSIFSTHPTIENRIMSLTGEKKFD